METVLQEITDASYRIWEILFDTNPIVATSALRIRMQEIQESISEASDLETFNFYRDEYARLLSLLSPQKLST